MELRKNTLESSPLSKWFSLQILLDPEEFKELLSLEDFFHVQIDRLLPKNEGDIAKKEVLHIYEEYVTALKAGLPFDEKSFKITFQAVWTKTLEALYSIDVPNERHMIKICLPVILLQPHRCDYSPFDQKFRSMSLQAESISWGLQISYPQLFQHPHTFQVEKVLLSSFANNALFKAIQKWVRTYTLPTTFCVDGKKITTPIRTGKKAFPWVNAHPGLKKRGITVVIKE